MRTAPNGLYRYQSVVHTIGSVAHHLKPIRTRAPLITPIPEPRTAPIPASPADSIRPRDREHGQAMVEFAAVLLPLILVLVGIIQFGFLFSAYVGVSNSAREAARMGTIYQFDTDLTPGQNDSARCAAILQAADQSLDPAVPGTFSGSCDTVSGGGDFAIAYPDSGTCTGSSRTGCLVRVTLTYRQPLFVPLIGTFLSSDGTGQVPLSATVTMVIN